MAVDSKFNTQVKRSLDALIDDIHETTEVLRRGSSKEREMPNYTAREQSPQVTHQTAQDLNGLEQLLDDYDVKRSTSAAKPVASARPSVQSLLTELDDSGHQSDTQAMSTAPPPRRSNKLDAMLGNLQTDMTKHGIHTIPKGECADCTKTIVGQVVIALGKMWHPEHFRCCQCGDELGHRNFFERDGRAYCDDDFHNMFSPRCAHCNGAIKERCVTAMGQMWHPEHFVCAECGGEFGEDGFHERDGRAFCGQHFSAMFAPKCQGCKRPIQNNFITALKTHWHPECFVYQGDETFVHRISQMGPVDYICD